MNEESGTGSMHAGALAPIFQIAEKLSSKMTGPEIIIWELLRLKPGGFKFRRQHPFGKYILDFYCHSVKLSIEVDGQNHDVQKQKGYDKNRSGFLRDMVVREIRFKNEEVIENLDLVMKEIVLELLAGSLQGTQGRAKVKNL